MGTSQTGIIKEWSQMSSIIKKQFHYPYFTINLDQSGTCITFHGHKSCENIRIKINHNRKLNTDTKRATYSVSVTATTLSELLTTLLTIKNKPAGRTGSLNTLTMNPCMSRNFLDSWMVDAHVGAESLIDILMDCQRLQYY